MPKKKYCYVGASLAIKLYYSLTSYYFVVVVVVVVAVAVAVVVVVVFR